MKKSISLFLAVLFVVSLCSCGTKSTVNSDSTPVSSDSSPSIPPVSEEALPEKSIAPDTSDSVEESEETLLVKEEVTNTFIPQRQRICAGASATAVLLNDGTVSCSLDRSADQYISVNNEWLAWSDIVDISMDEEILVAAKADGTVLWCGGRVKEYDWLTDPDTMDVIDSWRDMVQVSAGPFDIVALRTDGSLEITGTIWTEDLEETNGFIQVDVYDALFCLRKNGTVYCYAPTTYEGQSWTYNVDDWTGIIQISAGYDHAVGLKADGTVVATGNNENGQCSTDGWKDIVQVFAGRFHTIGLKADGTVVYCGEPPFGCGGDFLDNWTDIVEVSGFFDEIIGLKSDGTLIYAGPASRHNPVNVSKIG